MSVNFPSICPVCHGLIYLDEDETPRCLMCTGNPLVKRDPGKPPIPQGIAVEREGEERAVWHRRRYRRKNE